MNKFKNLSLRSKLIIAFLFVAFIPLAVGSYWNQSATERMLINHANQRLLTAAEQVGADIDAFLNHRLNEIKTDAKLPLFITYLSLPAEERAEIEADVVDTLRSLKDDVYISSVALLDHEGKTLIDTSEVDLVAHNLEHLHIQIPLQTGLPYVSAIEVFPGKVFQTGFYFTSSIQDKDKQIIGLLSVRYHMSILQHLIVKYNGLAGEDSFAILLDEYHVRLAHGTAPDLIFKSVVPLNRELLQTLQASQRLPLKPADELATNLPDFEAGLLNSEKNPYFITELVGLNYRQASIATTKLKIKPWVVCFAQPQAVFLAPIQAQTRTILLLVLTMILIMLIMTVYVSKILTNPILELTKMAEQISEGDLTGQVMVNYVNNQDEIGRLAMTFNNMTKQLADLIYRLEQESERYHLNNIELEEEITERKQTELRLQRTNQRLTLAFEDLRFTQQALLQAKQSAERANRAKSEFLSSMSHELRTPLNAILGYAQILQKESTQSETQLKGLSIIEESGIHLLTLINDILDMSKIEAGKMELLPSAIGLGSFLDSIVGIMSVKAQEKKLSFVYEADQLLPAAVEVDEKRLRQILINLLGNAIKFTDLGEVRLKVSLPPASPQGEHDSSALRLPLRFEIIDSGIGMTEEQLEKILLPFEQVGSKERRAEGTGLGLAITSQLIGLMGGKLQMSSAIGKGSCFCFEVTLPTIDVNPQKISQAQRVIGYQGAAQKILVVDDKIQNRFVLRDMLIPLGFEVIEAEDGLIAIEVARAQEPDLILTDLIMPVMDGFEAVKTMRQIANLQKVPIIAVSASVFEQHQKKSLDAGCDAFLPKPIRLEALLKLLKSHLSLEWRYADTPNTPASVEEQPFILPPREELEMLQNLAKQGNILRLRKQADYIETLDKKYYLFAKMIKELAKQFKYKQIQSLVEEYLESK